MPRRSVALAALAGGLLAFSFPPLDLTLFAWFGLAPLLLSLRGRTVQQGFWLGGIFGMVLFSGTIYWVTNSLHFYGRIPLVPAALITLLLCAYCAFYPALFGAAVAFFRQRRTPLHFAAAPALWTGLELARTHALTGFPWSLLGYSQHDLLPVIQVADLTGVYGISFLIVLVNMGIAGLIEDRRRVAPLLGAALALLAVLGYGWHRLNGEEGRGRLRIAIVQGNIDQDRKWDPKFQAEVLATYQRLTGNALTKRPDLVIWPETATSFYFNGTGELDAAMTADLRRFVRSTGVPLLFGSPTLDTRDHGYRLRNSAFFLDRAGAGDRVYHKRHLVPFGEYVPLRGLLFFVEKMVQGPGDFQAGSDYSVVDIGTADGRRVPVSTVICYEIIFPDLVRRFVDQGAAVLTTITNDAWFGRTGAPYQHFTMAVFRAVENRVPVARAANTGISGFIDAKGRVLGSSDIFTEAVLVSDVTPASGDRTFYTANGDVFAGLCVLVSMTVLFLRPRRTATPRTGAACIDDQQELPS